MTLGTFKKKLNELQEKYKITDDALIYVEDPQHVHTINQIGFYATVDKQSISIGIEH